MVNFARKRRRPSRNSRASKPRSLHYYLSARQYHRKLGKFATNSYFQLREFLQKEVTVPYISNINDGKFSNPEVLTKISKKQKNKKKKKNHNKPNDARSTIVPSAVLGAKATIHELKQITRRSNEVLARARTVFPLTLFPDDMVLDRTKLTINQRDFFMSSKTLSIRIEDILNVSADVGPFFGSITVASRILSSEDHFTINYFWRKDAIHMKHMIQGYVIALHNKIDVAHLNREELIETLAELGHDQNR